MEAGCGHPEILRGSSLPAGLAAWPAGPLDGSQPPWCRPQLQVEGARSCHVPGGGELPQISTSKSPEPAVRGQEARTPRGRCGPGGLAAHPSLLDLFPPTGPATHGDAPHWGQRCGPAHQQLPQGHLSRPTPAPPCHWSWSSGPRLPAGRFPRVAGSPGHGPHSCPHRVQARVEARWCSGCPGIHCSSDPGRWPVSQCRCPHTGLWLLSKNVPESLLGVLVCRDARETVPCTALPQDGRS